MSRQLTDRGAKGAQAPVLLENSGGEDGAFTPVRKRNDCKRNRKLLEQA